MSHHKKSPDGLDVNSINLSDGGVNSKRMRATKFINNEGAEGCKQQMEFQKASKLY